MHSAVPSSVSASLNFWANYHLQLLRHVVDSNLFRQMGCGGRKESKCQLKASGFSLDRACLSYSKILYKAMRATLEEVRQIKHPLCNYSGSDNF